MDIIYLQPPGYDDGAFQVAIDLTDEEKHLAKQFGPLNFPLPALPNRSVLSDHGFGGVMRTRGQTTRMGTFVDGEWHGHIYSNGIAEDTNPTSVDRVIEELLASVEEAIVGLRDWASLARRRQRPAQG